MDKKLGVPHFIGLISLMIVIASTFALIAVLLLGTVYVSPDYVFKIIISILVVALVTLLLATETK